MRSRANNAFTLLEVILAIGLVAVVITAAFGFYQHIAEVRDAVGADAEFSRTVRLVMNLMTSELQSSLVAHPQLQAQLIWTTDEIEFTTATLPGPAAWAQRQSTDDPIPPAHDVQLVTYSLWIAENEDGEIENHGLQRIGMTVLIPAADPGDAHRGFGRATARPSDDRRGTTEGKVEEAGEAVTAIEDRGPIDEEAEVRTAARRSPAPRRRDGLQGFAPGEADHLGPPPPAGPPERAGPGDAHPLARLAPEWTLPSLWTVSR